MTDRKLPEWAIEKAKDVLRHHGLTQVFGSLGKTCESIWTDVALALVEIRERTLDEVATLCGHDYPTANEIRALKDKEPRP